MLEIIPIRNNLIVEKIDDPLKSKTGLVLSEDTKERPTKGKVLAVGEGKQNDDGKILPMRVSVGDTVVYPRYAGHPIKVDGDEFLILEEKDVLALLQEVKNV